MKKSVRPAASKASGERGKTDAAVNAGGAKPASKTSNPTPLSKVKLIQTYTGHILEHFPLNYAFRLYNIYCVSFRLKAMMIF